jgi:hypothetical protein
LAKEAREKAEAEEKAEADKKAREVRKTTEKREGEAASKAERVRLANRKRLDRELIEFKERTEAEAKKKAEAEEEAKAEKGMKLATPDDVSSLDRARQINAETARIWEGQLKPKAGSSKAAATPMPKPKTPGNLASQVQNEEFLQKTGKLGKTGDAAGSSMFYSFSSGFLTCLLQVASCDMCVTRKDLCIYGSRVACLMCNERKVRCSFLDAKRKRRDEKIDSEADEEPTPKWPKTGGTKPSGPQF